ncbi:MAG: 2-oxoacid:acceptor oxidoreductase subunit alpha [Methanomicrobiales archaeon]
MDGDEISVLIGGRAGDGVSSAGQVVAQMLAHMGYQVHMYFDYPSLIKGGHNFAIIRGAERQVGAVRESVDFILALNQETIELHKKKLNPGGVIICNGDNAHHPGAVQVPIGSILNNEQAPAVMGNSAIIGAFLKVAGIDWDVAEEVFPEAVPKETDQNLRVARQAYDAADLQATVKKLPGRRLPVMTGNEAIGIGLLEGGITVYFAYPMSPTSNLMHFFAANTDEFHIRVIQPEGEIAGVLNALGCSYAGARAAIGTSGGGFCLMTEALGLAGIAELPLVIVLGQRAGPSTGLATYTAQSDLLFALNAGHGDFPRFIAAPGDTTEARNWSRIATVLAWKYQVPAIILSDKIICEGLYSTDPDLSVDCHAEPVMADPGVHPYMRYQVTGSGISPLRFPPSAGDWIKVNSHVHDTDGTTAEEHWVAKAMADKRNIKVAGMREEVEGLNPVEVTGNTNSDGALLTWGSNKGACDEVGKLLDLRVIRPIVVCPFPERSFANAMKGVRRFYSVETNETGQLARLVSQSGYRANGLVLKYDGRPFTIEELTARVREVIS